MSGLAIVPLAQEAGMADLTSMPLLEDKTSSHETSAPKIKAEAQPQRKPVHSPGWNGDLTHYQAQLIGAELAKSYARHQAKTSPRDAARAYAQARRRPQNLSSEPRLRSVM